MDTSANCSAINLSTDTEAMASELEQIVNLRTVYFSI